MDGKRVGHYLIQEKLGRGGMGVVYRATDTKLDRDVALKFLPPEWSAKEEAKARFVQEAKTASSLDHPNICTIHEIGESDDGQLYIAMSFYRGKTLRERLLEGSFDQEQALDIARQLSEGLKAAHSAGIIHRDIKPANIMVGDDGLVKILDFGLAKLGHGMDLTKAGSTVGTTAYMSPEQASGEEVDHRADLWSLGVILYEMLAGKRAFGGEYDQAVLYAVMNQSPEPLEGVDEHVSALVEALLQKNPAERPESAADVAARLGSSSGSGVKATPVVRSSRSPLLPYIVGAAALALVFVVLWMMPSSEDSAEDSTLAADQNRVLVLPFNILGDEEMDYLSEGMVTILSPMLDGTGTIRTVDPALILEQPTVQNANTIGPTLGSDLASRFGAGYFILGSISKIGNENRMSARLYTADGTSVSESLSSFSGGNDQMAAIDQLASSLVRELLRDPDQDLSSLAAGTTDSFDALRYYLSAEKLVRQGENAAALEDINKALELDSTFALGWYLRAEISGWLNSLDGSAQRDLRRAIRHSRGLSGRAPRILEAELAFQEGRWMDAESMYEAILRDYPEDLEATGQLAEVYIHFSPREDHHYKALRLFERVAELVPGSRQFGYHHSDMLAFDGLMTGSFHRLDSLAAVYAGMDIAEDGEQLDWSRALDMMNPSQKRYMAKFAILSGTAEDSVLALSMPMNQFSADQLAAYGLIDAAEAVYDSAEAFTPEVLMKHWLLQARGRLEGAVELVDERLDLDLVTESFILWKTVVWISHPALGLSQELRGRVYELLEEFESRPDFSPLEKDGTRAYVMAQLAFQQDDAGSFDRHLENFRAIEFDDHPVWQQLDSELSGLKSWQEGNVEEAIWKMVAAIPSSVSAVDFGANPLMQRNHPFFYLAQLHEDAGRLEEAAKWYKAVLFRPEAAPMGWEQAARVYEQLGDTDNAIRYYSLMVNQWEDADPVLQPRVEAARQRIDALLDESAREPQ